MRILISYKLFCLIELSLKEIVLSVLPLWNTRTVYDQNFHAFDFLDLKENLVVRRVVNGNVCEKKVSKVCRF